MDGGRKTLYNVRADFVPSETKGIICFNLQLIFVGFLQSEEGGAPGCKHSSFAGAAGPGHEPKPADIPGPGCRCDPGEA